ncbi:unnamed protein product [Rotaria socialis]|uniref:VWFA domain-containing protein n=4 Tax=Rotaria socialis TaxID=392032 RepID=A0A817XLR8_9BILA|nr:unnamed protein product [Rotaria socialis]CAF3368269.1 unnamed protein product [Rotaria socialis]CAF3744106.1 unnamed protein product [Rotaria socialis]CAF4255125.1 unnamed protein product [Rotaria socialis]CAF4316197.1 unnamed protein product [Rotaria socialis]
MMIYRWIICILFLSIHIKYGRAQGSAFRDIPNVYFTNLSAVSSTASPLTAKTTQYIRDQLVLLTEHFQSISLRSTDRVMRKIYMQSLDTFLIDKRNLTQLVREMANYTNRAIMKKLEAIRTLVTITEQSYRRFAETDEKTRNATAQYMLQHGYLSSKDVHNVTINSTYEDSSLRTTIDGLNNDNVDRSVTGGTTTPLSYTKATSEASTDSDTEEDVLKKKLFIQSKKHFGGAFVNITHSTVHVPTIIYSLNQEILLTANWSYNLNQAFIDNYNHDPELTWQYFCSQTGLYRVWPGHMWDYPEGDSDKLDLFDCRVQNWYIRATSSPRDVIILIDASGSMTGLKKSIAVQTVETILDTLSDDDFVQIIKFQENAAFIDDCFQSGLVQATVENRHKFRTSVNTGIETKDIANFTRALNMAFDLLDNARMKIARTENAKLICQCHYLQTDNQTETQRDAFCPSDLHGKHHAREEPIFLDSTGCNKMIMIVTDGATETALNVFQSRNWYPNNVSTCHPIETRVFTYMIGRELGDPKHIKWMSCANKGYYAHVSTLEDIQENVEDYIPVTARPIAMYNDHVTVWSSVFLDVERTLPIKTYKWFPFKLSDLSMSMDEFKNKSKPVHLMISIAQPVLNPPQDKQDENILLGAVGVDIPVKLLQEFSPKYRLGVHAYSFMINHNGYLMFHPDLRPVLGPYRKQNYHSIDLDMVEIPDNLMHFVHPLPLSKIQQIRKDMIQSNEYHESARVKKHFDDMRRIEAVEQRYFYATLGDKESNPFSLGIAVRFPYGEFDIRTTDPQTDKVEIALRFILQRNVRIADWIYCNSTAEDNIGDTEESFRGYLKEKIQTKRIKSCPYEASKQLINMMIEELYIMSKFENWTKTGVTGSENPSPLDDPAHAHFKEFQHENHLHWIFLATRSGITAYWQLYNLANEEHMRQFGDANPNSIESSYYERTINATYMYGADHIDGDHHIYSLFYGISNVPVSNTLGNGGTTTTTTTKSQMYLVITTAIWMNKTSQRPQKKISSGSGNVPFGVFGVVLPYKTVRSRHFSNLCAKMDTGICYIIDENGYIMFISQPEGTDRTEDIGKFIGEFEGPLMQDLVAKKIFSELKMVDFQGVCLQRKLRYEKSASGLFHGILQTASMMIWNIINHIAMFLVRDIVIWPQWTYAAKKANLANINTTVEAPPQKTHIRESLSNILLTYIDFRRPILDYKGYHNGSKDDDSIERVPESCIEEFNLYVSTWKGWLGPLPSTDNSVTWEQVERDNSVHGTISCTHVVKETENFDDFYGNNSNGTNYSTTIPPSPTPPVAESFSYSISKIPKSNLMMVYVNHPKETSQLCPKLIIKRKPVEFTPEEWCTRLKTTPYRERPQKCFFVHEGENKTLFSKCSYALRLTNHNLLTNFMWIIILSFYHLRV